MIDYNKSKIREALTIEDVFELLTEFNAEPEYASFGIISKTICHNHPSDNPSRKLYYYTNTGLFTCWTGCGSFDIFELVQKVMSIQYHDDFDLNDAVRWVAFRFGIEGFKINKENGLIDWSLFENYDRIDNIKVNIENIQLQEYDDKILNNFNYNVKIRPWIKEGISEEILKKARIGFYPGADVITIPHFDKDNRFIGLRGRALCKEEAEAFGKYRPVKVNGIIYKHPLGFNLYTLPGAYDEVSKYKKAIVFESEKAVLQWASFGFPNVAFACCGSNFGSHQMKLLRDAGAEEIIIGFDKQFKEIGDDEFKVWVKKLKKINDTWHNYVNITFMFDKWGLLSYKDSPTDLGKAICLELFNRRISYESRIN